MLLCSRTRNEGISDADICEEGTIRNRELRHPLPSRRANRQVDISRQKMATVEERHLTLNGFCPPENGTCLELRADLS
ncbi:hypothetical protein GN956_G4846 [Arapaima gigas]